MRHHHPARTCRYIWQLPDWPRFTFDATALAAPLAQVHRAQGMLAGRMGELGMAQRDQANLQVLTQEVITTSAIEGERLDLDAVRSSVARKLGLDIGANLEEFAASDRHVDGVVDVVLDATRNFDQALTPERLFGWHAALFPTGYSGRMRITVAAWRLDASGPMQVVSGPVGREKVHFQAPPAATLPALTGAFFDWFEAAPVGDTLIKAGLAHLWLVTLHPFDDGNGRLSRAVGDMALARAEGNSQRFYSFSAQIQRERKDYYDQLEATQKGPLDVTPWLSWFLGCLLRAVQGADATLVGVGQSPVLAALGGHAHEYTANAGAEPCAGRHGGQADQRQMGSHWQMLCGHCAARHQRPAGARRAAQTGGWGKECGVYAGN